MMFDHSDLLRTAIFVNLYIFVETDSAQTPINSWSVWSKCSANCGPGLRARPCNGLCPPTGATIQYSRCLEQICTWTETTNDMEYPISAEYFNDSFTEYAPVSRFARTFSLFIRFRLLHCSGILFDNYGPEALTCCTGPCFRITVLLYDCTIQVILKADKKNYTVIPQRSLEFGQWHDLQLTILRHHIYVDIDNIYHHSFITDHNRDDYSYNDGVIRIGQLVVNNGNFSTTQGFRGLVGMTRVNYVELLLNKTVPSNNDAFSVSAREPSQMVNVQLIDLDILYWFPRFNGSTYATLTLPSEQKYVRRFNMLVAQIVIQSVSDHGTILFAVGFESGNYFSLSLESGRLKLCYKRARFVSMCHFHPAAVNTTQQQPLDIHFEGNELWLDAGGKHLTVKYLPYFPIRHLHFGGAPNGERGFRGYIYSTAMMDHIYYIDQLPLYNAYSSRQHSIWTSRAVTFVELLRPVFYDLHLDCTHSEADHVTWLHNGVPIILGPAVKILRLIRKEYINSKLYMTDYTEQDLTRKDSVFICQVTTTGQTINMYAYHVSLGGPDDFFTWFFLRRIRLLAPVFFFALVIYFGFATIIFNFCYTHK